MADKILTFYFYDPDEHKSEPPVGKMYPVTLRGMSEEDAAVVEAVFRANGAKMIVHGEATDREVVAEAYAQAVVQSMREIRPMPETATPGALG